MKNLLKTLLLCGVALVIGGTVIEVYGYAKYRAFPSNPLVVLLNPSQLYLQKTFSSNQCNSDGFRPIVAFSSDGKILVSSTLDGSVAFWLPHFKSSRNSDATWNRVKAIAFHPDGQILAVGRAEGTVELIEPKTMETIRVLPTNPESVRVKQPGALAEITSVAFSPDGKTIAVGSVKRLILPLDALF